MLMLIDTPDPRHGDGSHPPRGRERRLLAGGMACLVFAHFFPVVGALLLAGSGLAMLVVGLYVIDDEPTQD